MKKSRLLFLLPLIASFALTACDLSSLMPNTPRRRSSKEEESQIVDDSFNRPSSSTSTSSTHTHKWSSWYVVQEPTCVSYGVGERQCRECGQTERRQIDKTNNHTWGEWEIYDSPKCETEGIQRRVCLVCQYEEYVSIPATGHFYNEEDVVWESAPTCVQEGRGWVYCQNCGAYIAINKPVTGHALQLVDYHTPNEGQADVKVYTCLNCNEATFLGFVPNQVTNASKQHLVFQEDGGTRFWGRPIGNIMLLDSNGNSINQYDGECIYDKNETGDYFEFAFDLSKEQADLLNECYLYCDAKPADYLNGTDFWAYGASNVEWTPGHYIDDDPNHYDDEGIGKRVENYRYVLYVDGQYQDFNPNIKALTHGSNTNMVREEFVLPYKFHLHEGLNSFSLHMAGGFRSTFYGFTFRKIIDDPYEPVSLETIQEWDYADIESCRTDSGWQTTKEWDNGVKGFKFNKGDGSFTLNYSASSYMRVRFDLLLAVKISNKAKTGFWRQDGVEKTAIEINGQVIEPPSDDLDFTNVKESSVMDNGALSYPEWYFIAKLDLVPGLNQIKVRFITGGYSYFMCGARITKS